MNAAHKEIVRQRMIALWADPVQKARRLKMVSATMQRNRKRQEAARKRLAEQATYKLPRIPYAPMPELAEMRRLLEQEG